MEISQREENTHKRLVTKARFTYIRTLDQLDFSIIPSVNKAGVLELAKGNCLEKNENIVLIGNMGTRKTYTAVALGMLACQLGKKPRFHTATSLVKELLEAQIQHSLGKRLTQLVRLELLIVNELGFVTFTPEGAWLLFRVFPSAI